MQGQTAVATSKVADAHLGIQLSLSLSLSISLSFSLSFSLSVCLLFSLNQYLALPLVAGGRRGNLIVRLKVKTHPKLQRIGSTISSCINIPWAYLPAQKGMLEQRRRKGGIRHSKWSHEISGLAPERQILSCILWSYT